MKSYTDYMDRIKLDSAAREKILTHMRAAHDQDTFGSLAAQHGESGIPVSSPSKSGRAGRFIAIAAALAICAVGGTVMWNYVFGGQDNPPPPSTTPPDITASPSPDGTPSPPPSPGLIQLDMNQLLIDLDWPEPAVYEPEITVFPAVSSSGHFKTHMSGPITFLDESLEPVPLPFAPTWYAPVRSGGGTVAFTVGIPEKPGGHHVLMLADGTLARGADGEYISAYDSYEHSYTVVGSLVVTSRLFYRSDEAWPQYKYGLFDMETRSELLPCEYDKIEAAEENILFVSKDGFSWLLNSKGDVLYAFGEDDTTGVDGPYGQGYGSNYYLDEKNRAFHRIPVIEGRQMATLEMLGGYYVTRDGGGMDASGPVTGPLYVFDASGLEIYRARHYWFTLWEDELIVSHGGGFDVITRNGEIRRFPADLRNQTLYAHYLDGEVYWIEYDPLVYDAEVTYRYYSADEAGNVREWETPETPETVRPDIEGYADGPVEYNASSELYTLRDTAGNIILETTDSLLWNGAFVIRLQPVAGHDCYEPAAIYTPGGSLLTDDFYGVVYEAPGPGGGIFVYLDPDTCILLFPDGRAIPVPNAPRVEKTYFG
ncbi:MAG: hypothetical protein FWG72_00125 [Oscillospiraceae bacterium]|nr:hypothetical protein [Oscillospiraceae bacterium]